MIKKALILFLILGIITSCSEKKHEIESSFKNGNPEIVSLFIKDTVIHNKKFKLVHKIKFNNVGDTLRKGRYINNIAIGKHYFYSKQYLECVRNYVVPEPYFTKTFNELESSDFKQYKLRNDSTYLNEAIFFNKKGDTIYDKSHFYTAKLNKNNFKFGDSIIVDFKFYFPKFKVYKTDLYYKEVEDTSMITLILNNYRDCGRYAQKVSPMHHNKVIGAAEIFVSKEIKKDSVIGTSRLIFIEKKFNTK